MRAKGFTLVELLSTLGAGSLVFLAIGISLMMGIRFWTQTLQQVEWQRDLTFAIQVMSRTIREGSSATLPNGSSELQVVHVDGTTRYYLIGDDLLCDEPNRPAWTICEGVQNLTFSMNGSEIGVRLTLAEGSDTIQSDTTAWMRNTGG